MPDCQYFFQIKVSDDERPEPIIEEEFKCNSLDLLIRYLRQSMDKVEDYHKKYKSI